MTPGEFYFAVMNTETLRTICLELPAVTEDIKWEKDVFFSIGGKMFCVTSFEEPFKASFKVPDADFEELCSREGFIPAPYMARAKWVMVSNDAALSKQEWMDYIKQSHELVSKGLTRKLRKELGLPE